MTIKWTTDMSVGVEKIDEQHRELARRINAIYKAVTQDNGPEEVAPVFYFLEEYIVRHFTDEQALMSQYEYPEKDEHLTIHNAFIRDVLSLKIKYEEEGCTPELLEELQERVSDWFVDHVMVRDKALGLFISEKSAQ